MNQYSLMNGENKDIIISIDDQQFTAKNCILTSLNIEQDNSFSEMMSYGSELVSIPKSISPTTITLEFKVLHSNTFFEMFEGNNKISNKKVKDCSIQELLFAVRKKIK